MTQAIKLKIDNLNEFDVMELEQELQRAGGDPASQIVVSKSEVPKEAFGVPADITMILEIAQVAVPAMIGVLALWISKGRETTTTRKVAISWTKDGINFERVNYDHEKESDTSTQIKNALEASIANVLKSKADEGHDDSQLD